MGAVMCKGSNKVNAHYFPRRNELYYVYLQILSQFERKSTYKNTHTVHMALMGYFIVFSFVTKPGQTLEFLL